MAQINPNSPAFSPEASIYLLLKERLEKFAVPKEILEELRNDIMMLMSSPSKMQFKRAAVMTPQASISGDEKKKGRDIEPGSSRPTQI
jgi:hypothetical protein